MKRVPKTTHPDGRNNTKENYEEARKIPTKEELNTPQKSEESKSDDGEREES